MRKTKIILLLMLTVIGFTAVFPVFHTYTESCAVDSAVNVSEHTPQEIKQYIESHQFNTYQYDTYTVEPSTSYPYLAGSLDNKSLQNALNALNCMRYIAGLPEVSLNSEYSNLAQHAALVDCVNDVLTHFPEQPSNMSDDIYEIGAKGARSSNMAYMSYSWDNYKNTAYSIMLYMEDSDYSNIARLGHRRWCLNPNMKETGFGSVDHYSAMYAHDLNRTEATEKGVCWPAQNMPTQYFDSDTAWSISIGKDLSDCDIKVNLKRRSDSKEWNFSSNASDGAFYNENSYFGQKGCIIFRPSDISINANDVYDVRIEGMEEPVEYTVNFFSLNDIPDQPVTYSLGDVNGDGLTDAVDAAAVLAEYVAISTSHESTLSEEQKKSADVNSDGATDSSDASQILAYYSYTATTSSPLSMEEWILQ